MADKDDFNFFEWVGIPDVDGNGKVDSIDAMIAEDMFYGDSYNTGLFGDSWEKDNHETFKESLSKGTLDPDDFNPFDFNKDIF